MPEISIIVPVYNVQPYLRECMESLIGQTFRNIEIICIDDGSTDDSVNILAQYAAADARVKVLTQPNSGQATARNAGLAVATSPYIMFCDSDDRYAPNMCEKMYAAMQGRADMAICGVQEIVETGQSASGTYFDLPTDGEETVDDSMLIQLSWNPWNKIYHRGFLEGMQVRFPEGLYFEDAYFYAVYTAYVQRIAFVTDKLYYYRRRGNSTMGRVLSGETGYTIDHVHVANRIWLYYEEHGLTERRLCYLVNIWLKLCSAGLELSGTAKGSEHMEKEMIAFAERHIIRCAGLSTGTMRRLGLIMKHRWVGFHRHLGGCILSKSRERFTSKGFTIKRKYYLMGIPVWKQWVRIPV